ncbi:GDP-mannose 4,6-dehydratase [Marinomonas sp. 2405UD68-3]|uniref:GDP-mannose 4,6-dehydratase n=1 Tax=Marinomonas sp. 2405UD68-3 TaxID=3391835 RepID=UPI0039C9FB19
MKDVILVTGATGFVGSVLLPKLAAQFPNAHIVGLSYRHKMISASSKITYYSCNLKDKIQVNQLIREIRPSYVINLAAISHIPTALNDPDLTWDINLHGVLNLLNALVEIEVTCTFLQVGSGDCYGQSFSNGERVNEKTPFMPMNPYAASKAAADLAAFSYRHQGKLKIIRARPFNHSGAGQSDKFVIPSFANQIVRIEKGLQKAELMVGNLNAKRCFLHVDDVVDAYIALLLNHQDIASGEAFNIVSDESISIKSVLDKLLDKSDKTIDIFNDPEKQRPSDISKVEGCAYKLKKATHWEPKITLDHLLNDVLTYFREK